METALIVYTQGSNEPTMMDLYLNETISLQYSFNDIQDLKARATYSRSFRIPATDNNSKIFGFIENNTFQFSSFNPKRKLQAIITRTIATAKLSQVVNQSYTSIPNIIYLIFTSSILV